jgi:hypothetical protein
MKRFDKILTDVQEVLLPHKTHSDVMKNETPETELMEYKKDFLDMNVGSLRAIMKHAQSILEAVETNDPTTKENLTESWLQGKIAITEDYMRTIHDFVKYVPSDDDKSVAGCGCGGSNKKQPPKDFKAKVAEETPDIMKVRIAPVKETEAEIEKKD